MSKPSSAAACWAPAGMTGSTPAWARSVRSPMSGCSHAPRPSATTTRTWCWSRSGSRTAVACGRCGAKRVVLATGAHERPLIFANNDRPGIMLAGAARTYVNRYGVAPGKRAVIFTNNDSTDAVAADLKRAGITVEAIVDVRAGEAVIDTFPSPARGGGQGGGLCAVLTAP